MRRKTIKALEYYFKIAEVSRKIGIKYKEKVEKLN